MLEGRLSQRKSESIFFGEHVDLDGKNPTPRPFEAQSKQVAMTGCRQDAAEVRARTRPYIGPDAPFALRDRRVRGCQFRV